MDWEVDKKNQIIDFYIEGDIEKAHSGVSMDTIPDICEQLLADAGYIIDWKTLMKKAKVTEKKEDGKG